MPSAIFICPFDPVTRQTSLPELDEGETLDFWHKIPEQEASVVCELRGTQARIDAMKADPAYCWIEDVEVPSADIKADKKLSKVEDAKKVKDYLKSKGHKQTDIDKQKWSKADDIVESVVKLHGATLESYRGCGLG